MPFILIAYFFRIFFFNKITICLKDIFKVSIYFSPISSLISSLPNKL